MIQIRPAKEDDARDLAAMNDEFNATQTSQQDIRERLTATRSNELICVADKEGSLIGFACAQFYSSICYPEPVGEITEIYVRNAYRRRGVAKRMLVFLEDALAGIGVSEIRAATNNANAEGNGLFHSAGYSQDNHCVYRKWAGIVHSNRRAPNQRMQRANSR